MSRRRRSRNPKDTPALAAAWLVDEAQVPDLVALLVSPDRQVPVVVAACRGSAPPVDPSILAISLGESAHVVSLAGARTGWALTRALPKGTPDVYGGATRIYRPDLAASAHPLVRCFPGDDVHLVTQQILDHARSRAPGIVEERLADDRQAAASPAQVREAVGGEHQHEPIALADLVDGNDRLREELRQARSALREAQDQIAALEAHLEELHQDRSRPVYADPEQQLRHEIHLHWLHTDLEEHRKPLRPYVIGVDFLASLEADLIDRERAIGVCVQVLTRVVHDIPARETHQLRENASGGAPARRRPDGAVAWRAALRRSTPGAPRLMWWELPDDSVELGRAAHHDDTYLR